MIGTFFFYLTRTFHNRIRIALKRLKQPKYLISALVGLGYLYLVFFRQAFSRSVRRPPMPVGGVADLLPLIETIGAFALLLMVILPWIWPGRGGGLGFTEPEIQFLFPAPVSRRALVNFRLLKMQLGILFGVLISFVVFGRGRFFDHPAYFMVTLWIIYSFWGLYSVGTNLIQMSLAENGISGFKRQVWVLAILVGLAVSVVVWARGFVSPMPQNDSASLKEMVTWLVRITEAGPAYYFLYPFRTLVRPAFATTPATFLLRVLPALAILGLVYLWVIWTDVSFEEASLERARKVAMRLEAARSGSWRSRPRKVSKGRRPPFELSPTGPPFVAVFWKNLISTGRLSTMRILPAVVSIGIGLAIVFSQSGKGGNALPMIVGTVAMAIAGFFTLLGPVMVRDDFRSDLLQIDLLKTLPVKGWNMVLGEVLAPVALLTLIQWTLLLIAAIVLPSLGKMSLSIPQRIEFGVSAALLLPCFSLVGILIQNAAALIWPGWIELGKGHRQGIEAMGQRLITMAATILTLVLVVLPAGIIFALVFFLGSWLIGMAILPFCSLIAALAILLEAAFAIAWMGRIYDKFDASRI
jgi:ABC-2 type transport system permease protein